MMDSLKNGGIWMLIGVIVFLIGLCFEIIPLFLIGFFWVLIVCLLDLKVDVKPDDGDEEDEEE